MFPFTNYDTENDKFLDDIDPNLQQGKVFLEYETTVKKMTEPYLPLIEQTSSPHLGSLIEGLKDRQNYAKKDKTVNKVIQNIIDEINISEDKFYELLNKYHTLHRNIIKHKLDTYVTTDDLHYYYINMYGYKQQIKFEGNPTKITFKKVKKKRFG